MKSIIFPIFKETYIQSKEEENGISHASKKKKKKRRQKEKNHIHPCTEITGSKPIWQIIQLPALQQTNLRCYIIWFIPTKMLELRKPLWHNFGYDSWMWHMQSNQITSHSTNILYSYLCNVLFLSIMVGKEQLMFNEPQFSSIKSQDEAQSLHKAFDNPTADVLRLEKLSQRI